MLHFLHQLVVNFVCLLLGEQVVYSGFIRAAWAVRLNQIVYLWEIQSELQVMFWDFSCYSFQFFQNIA